MIRHSQPIVLRRLLRQPLFALLSVLTLGLALGANSALFSVVDTILIQPLPYPESDRLVGVWNSAPGLELDQFEHSDGTFQLYHDENRVFESLGIYQFLGMTLTGEAEPERLDVVEITPSILEVLQAAPAIGRGFDAKAGQPGSEPVVLLSHGLWQERFGGDPQIVGRTLVLDGIHRAVVGVMGSEFRFPSPETQLWTPIDIDPGAVGASSFSYPAIARLRPGVDREAARRDLDSLVPRIGELYGDDLDSETLEQISFATRITSMRDDIVGDLDQTLWILFAGVGLILLIACANIANLFLVRAEGRQQELAVRSALGARRGRVASMFLGESLVLGAGGAVLGLGLAHLGLQLVVRWGPRELPRLQEIALDGRTVTFTLVAALVACLTFGVLPILRRLPQPALALRDGGRAVAGGRGQQRVRSILVVAQVALAMMLLVGSGLMLRSFDALRQVDPGFDTEGILTLRLALPDRDYPTATERAQFFERALDTVAALPGVTSVGGINFLPLGNGDSASGYNFEDFQDGDDSIPPVVPAKRVAPGTFESLGIPILRGRDFTHDDTHQARRVALISAPLAERLWPGEDPTGKRLQRGDMGPDRPWTTIVGVVGGVRHRNLEDDPQETVYHPLLEPGSQGVENATAPPSLTLTIRTPLPPTSLTGTVRRAVWSLDPNLPIAEVRPIETLVRTARARTGFTMVLLSIAATVALILGAVGLYGVISTLVGQRTREIGVRLALGATQARIHRMVLSQGLTLAIVGLVGGLVGSLASGSVLRSVLFGVAPWDPWTLLGVSAVLLTVASVACLLPARRAAAVDPLRALQHE